MTSKQRAYLRGLANTIEPIFQVGKGGLTENLIKQLSDALEARELIKITVLKNAPDYAIDPKPDRTVPTDLCKRNENVLICVLFYYLL